MKSKFFGFNAKLALALLAISGTMLTSCYEKDDSDIPLPVVLPDPVYSISGQVTDIVTGAGLQGVAVNGTTTDANGNYQITTKDAGTLALAFSKTGYQAASASVNIVAVERGQSASYFVSIAMKPDGYVDSELIASVAVGSYGKTEQTFTANEYPEVDWINNTSSPINVSVEVTVNSGVKYDDTQLVNISSAFKTAIIAYLNTNYGSNLTGDFTPVKDYAKYVLPTFNQITSLTATTYYNLNTISFRYNNETAVVQVVEAVNSTYTWEVKNNGHSHGTGHNHGHGGDLNAGGGIIEPLF